MKNGQDTRRRALSTMVQHDAAELRHALDTLVEAVRADVARTRQSVHQIRERLDPGRRVAANPLPALVGAFLVGVWLGWRGRGGRP